MPDGKGNTEGVDLRSHRRLLHPFEHLDPVVPKAFVNFSFFSSITYLIFKSLKTILSLTKSTYTGIESKRR